MKNYKKKLQISVYFLEKIYFLKNIRDFSTIFIKKLLIFGKFWYIFYFFFVFFRHFCIYFNKNIEKVAKFPKKIEFFYNFYKEFVNFRKILVYFLFFFFVFFRHFCTYFNKKLQIFRKNKYIFVKK